MTRGPDTTSRRQRTWAAGVGEDCRLASRQIRDPMRKATSGDHHAQGLKVASLQRLALADRDLDPGEKKGCPIHSP